MVFSVSAHLQEKIFFTNVWVLGVFVGRLSHVKQNVNNKSVVKHFPVLKKLNMYILIYI